MDIDNFQIPENHRNCLYFKFMGMLKGFDMSEYKSSLTEDRASDEEICIVLMGIYKILKESQPRVKLLQMCSCFLLLFFLAIIAGVPTFVLVSSTDVSVGVAGGLTIFVLISTLVYCAFNCIINKCIKNKSKLLKKRANDYIMDLNGLYMSRGLRWHLPVNFPESVELWRDYDVKLEDGVDEAPIYGIVNIPDVEVVVTS